MPLQPSQIKSKPPGDYADQGGLYLCVRGSGGNVTRIWQFRFTDLDGKRAGMDICRVGDRDIDGKSMTQSTARETCLKYKTALKRDGIDPRVKKQAETKGGITFKQYADKTYPDWCVGKNPDEPKAWARSIADMAMLHDMKMHEIDSSHVVEALKTIWFVKPITANRTRERLEKLFDSAKVDKIRSGDNPAQWRGNLKLRLPSARKLNKKKGHASVPYARAPNLMHALRYDVGNVARCVEVGILTVTRSQEIRGMRWDELDLDDKKTWLIPGNRMKIKGDTAKGKPHLVPLSDQAIEIIKSMLPRRGELVFPSDALQNDGEHVAFLPNALTNCIKRTGIHSTMHGTRTTFRNWGADNAEHNFRREVLEFCLSHRLGDEAELSYWTSEMLDRRREVMNAWADYIKPRKTVPNKGSKKPNLKLVA